MRMGFLVAAFFVLVSPSGAWAFQEVVDATGRRHRLPHTVTRILCSGSGALRLATYLEVQGLVVGVDEMERREGRFDARPYALANPFFKTLPIFGGFRGRDNPERILSLPSRPQVIFKTYPHSGMDPCALEKKTGIPVVALSYGDLNRRRKDFFGSLLLMGKVIGKTQRAASVIAFFEAEIEALREKTKNLPEKERKRCFVGGIAFKGAHGFASTEPGYPPFVFAGASNVACSTGGAFRHSHFSKEALLMADPEVFFLDLSTLQMGSGKGGLFELGSDPLYRELSAVKAGRVFGLLPYNWYAQNFGSILADAWFVGKTLYPERFADIDPMEKADRIYTFLVGKPLFHRMNRSFGEMAFKPVLKGDGGWNAF